MTFREGCTIPNRKTMRELYRATHPKDKGFIRKVVEFTLGKLKSESKIKDKKGV